jgi:hypothetical protein
MVENYSTQYDIDLIKTDNLNLKIILPLNKYLMVRNVLHQAIYNEMLGLISSFFFFI